MPPRGGVAKHRPMFHVVVLSIGFVVGGFMTVLARRFLPDGSVKHLLTTAVTPTLGPVGLDLVIVRMSLGPIALDVSLLSLLGVLIAYMIARSLF
jgi:hypothetical protein